MSSIDWNGEGLPTVGANVESEEFGGLTVLAYGVFRGQTVVLCQGDDTIITATADRLRPLRTAEQIAADERKASIQAIQSASCGECGPAICEAAAAAIHDAGYRKP